MVKTLIVTIVAIFSVAPAMAASEACIRQFNDYTASKAAMGVPVKHQPRLYLPEKENGKVAIFIHGMFESPYFYKGISKTYQEAGYITINPLLPGHWEGDWNRFDLVSYKDWLKETRIAMNLARCFSSHILLGGHSTGGILAMNAAIENQDEVMGLMLWSPAVKLTKLAWLGGPIGDFFGLSGNTFKWTTPDHDEVTYYAPNSSVQLEILINYIIKKHGDGRGLNGIYRKLTMPTFLAYAENDPVISVPDLTAAGYQIPGMRDVMYFKTNTGIWHESVAKFPEDAYRAKTWDYNVKFRDMKVRMLEFMNNILY